MNSLPFKHLDLGITDAHVHFFDTEKMSYPWLDEVPAIKKTFDIEHYQAATKTLPIEKIVFVQCECLPAQYLDEVEHVTNLAQLDQRIQGIVAYFPLESNDAAAQLKNLITNKLVKGIRRLEENPSLYHHPTFVSNLSLLQQNNLSFDICLRSHQLDAAIYLVNQQPDLSYMLDHLGKPDINHKEFKNWSAAIKTLAENPNVYCKISGMFNEANHDHWTIADLKPYFEHVLDCFGTDRMVFGSDWPVLTLVDSYQRWLNVFFELSKDLAQHDIEKILSTNANRFYRLT
jgi:L-fuconolactonase